MENTLWGVSPYLRTYLGQSTRTRDASTRVYEGTLPLGAHAFENVQQGGSKLLFGWRCRRANMEDLGMGSCLRDSTSGTNGGMYVSIVFAAHNSLDHLGEQKERGCWERLLDLGRLHRHGG